MHRSLRVVLNSGDYYLEDAARYSENEPLVDSHLNRNIRGYQNDYGFEALSRSSRVKATYLNKLEKHMNGDWEGKCCCGFSTYEGAGTDTGGIMYAFYVLEIHVRKCKKHEKEAKDFFGSTDEL